jgi:hypothetical protein
MTNFNNADEREIFDAILLLKDENLVWSSDLEAIRRNPLNLIRETERGSNARGTGTTTEEIILQSKDYLRKSGCQGSGHPCQCNQ